MLTAQAESRTVNLSMTEDEARFVLLVMAERQRDCAKCPPEYPKHVAQVYQDLDVKIERLKMKLANQI